MIISNKKRLDMMFQIYRDQLKTDPDIDMFDTESLHLAASMAEDAVDAFLDANKVMGEKDAVGTIGDMLEALQHHNIKPNWKEKADA